MYCIVDVLFFDFGGDVMLRSMFLGCALVRTAGCGKMIERANQTRTVAAPLEDVFARMFGDDGAFAGLPLVTNGGSTRLYEIVAEKGEPGFEKLIPDERPEAYKVKLAVSMEIPRAAHLSYSVVDGALRTGLNFTFYELALTRTPVAFPNRRQSVRER